MILNKSASSGDDIPDGALSTVYTFILKRVICYAPAAVPVPHNTVQLPDEARSEDPRT